MLIVAAHDQDKLFVPSMFRRLERVFLEGTLHCEVVLWCLLKLTFRSDLINASLAAIEIKLKNEDLFLDQLAIILLEFD